MYIASFVLLFLNQAIICVIRVVNFTLYSADTYFLLDEPSWFSWPYTQAP